MTKDDETPQGSFYIGHAIRATLFAGMSCWFGARIIATHQSKENGRIITIFPTAFGALSLAYFALIESRWVLRRRHLPDGDLGVPILGAMVAVITNPIAFLKPWQTKQDLMLLHFLFKSQIMALTDKEHQWIWTQERKGNMKGFWPDHWTELMGANVVSTSHGKLHKQLRKWIEPAFWPAAVRDYLQVLDETVQKTLQSLAERNEFISTQVLRKFALRLLFVAIFQQENEERLSQLDKDIGIWFKGFESLFPYNIPGTLFGKAKQARVRLMENIAKLVEEFEQMVTKDPSKTDTLLGRLLQASKNKDENEVDLSRDDLYANLNVLFFAGHDTTYATTSNLIHYLVEYPQARKALLEEVQTLPEPLTFDSLKPENAPFLNAFINETMRIDPVIPASSKESLVEMKHNGYKVPRGFIWTASLVASSRNVRDPESFLPERFLPANHPYVQSNKEPVDEDVHEDVHRPFGGGAHVCIGQHFAKLELKIILVRLVQHYDIQVRNVKKQFFPLIYHQAEFKLTAKAH